MDPITQGTLGAVMPQSLARSDHLRSYAVLGFFSGLAPDLDIFISSATDPFLYLEFHRQFSHSLIFIPVGAMLCCLLIRPLLARLTGSPMPWREAYLACLLGYATHGLLDACTSYGTQLFWPFSTMRVAWNSVSVVDPLFTLPLMGLVAAAFVTRRRKLALVGVGWAVVYILIGVAQHQRVLDAASSLALQRGHSAVKVTVKPGFANLLVWKSIYEANGRYWVDGVRAGLPITICPGESAAKLSMAMHLPWLDLNSQQARDIERFRWFSNDFLALDQQDPFYVVDVRYSSLPNRIDALWGLRTDPRAEADQHASYHVVGSRRTEDLDRLWLLLIGNGCEAVSSD